LFENFTAVNRISRKPPAEGVHVQNFTVCVVDDRIDDASLLCEGLSINNFNAVAVHTGTEALERCRHGGIHLILLDVRLPDISGFDVCRQLKADPDTRDIGVIFVTAKDSRKDVAEGMTLGALDYIVKPYNLPMVMVRVEAALRRLHQQGHIEAPVDIHPDLVYTDQLTGLRNRRFLLERLDEEVEKAHRFKQPLTCLVAEVEDVTGLDSELGAASLDDVLVEFALAMRNTSRNYDILARYDGTVFIAVLPHTPLNDAVAYARKLEAEVDATTFSEPNFPTRVRLSFGLVCCQNGSVMDAEPLLGEAMRNLFKAKSGHNGKTGRGNLHARDLSAPPEEPVA